MRAIFDSRSGGCDPVPQMTQKASVVAVACVFNVLAGQMHKKLAMRLSNVHGWSICKKSETLNGRTAVGPCSCRDTG